jgi:hypothetical protein
VRIRSRKPWVLDRRRLFGWNVRLLTRYSYGHDSAGARGAGGTRGPRPGPPGTGRCDRHRPEDQRHPCTDSGPHSRGRRPPGGPSTGATDATGRGPGDPRRRRPATSGNGGSDLPHLVARLWTRLLASPTPRAGPDRCSGTIRPVTQTGRAPVSFPERAADLHTCVPEDTPVPRSVRLRALRAQAVETCVDPAAPCPQLGTRPGIRNDSERRRPHPHGARRARGRRRRDPSSAGPPDRTPARGRRVRDSRATGNGRVDGLGRERA